MNAKRLLSCLISLSLLSIANQARATTQLWVCYAGIRESNGKEHKAHTKVFPDSRDDDKAIAQEFGQWLMTNYQVQGGIDTSGKQVTWLYNADGLFCSTGSAAELESRRAAWASETDDPRWREIREVSWTSAPPASNAGKMASRASSNSQATTASPGSKGPHYDKGLSKCVTLGGDSQSVYFDNGCNMSVYILEYQKGQVGGGVRCGANSRCTFGIAGMGYTRREDFTYAVCPIDDYIETSPGNQWQGKGPFACRRP